MLDWIPKLLPRRAPPGRKVFVPNIPDWDPEIDCGSGPIVPFHQSLYLGYRDAYGNESERRITTRSLRRWTGDDVAIWAWCHERDAPRTFLATRVLELTDIETGEIYQPATTWLQSQYEEWPEVRDELGRDREEKQDEEQERRVKEEEKLALRQHRESEKQRKRELTTRLRLGRTAVLALVYVAKADGRMDAAERAVIAVFVRAIERSDGVDFGWSDIQARIRKLVCDQEEFLTIIKTLRGGPATLRREILAAANHLIAADGEISQNEHRAVSWLRVMLGDLHTEKRQT